MIKSEFKKISIIGLGLIGTSILHGINAKQKEGVTTFAYDANSKHRDIVSEMKIATFVCDDIQDANKLDNILWEKPKFAIISHQLVTENTEGIVRIGYPGTKFGLEADCLINISPDLPRDLDTYQFYYQLVIMDGDKLRERAAETWAQCKNLGLDTTFFESL